MIGKKVKLRITFLLLSFVSLILIVYLIIKSLEEKPQDPKSKIASIGIYFYPNEVIDLVKNVN